MAAASDGRFLPRVGLRHTLRFQWKDASGEVMPRDVFCKKLLMEQLKLKIQDVYCLQWHPQARAYDVTFVTAEAHQDIMACCKACSTVCPIAFFDVVDLDRQNFRVITVHMFNPFVTDQALKDFLGRYGEVVSAVRYIKDPFGFWTGRRQFQVLLNEDSGSPDGFQHPPAFFQLGADRGHLFHSRQPPFCRRCRQHGHVDAACRTVRCHFCDKEGHVAEACPYGKVCNGCRSPGHVYRDCPSRSRSFAEITATATVNRGSGITPVPKEMVERRDGQLHEDGGTDQVVSGFADIEVLVGQIVRERNEEVGGTDSKGMNSDTLCAESSIAVVTTRTRKNLQDSGSELIDHTNLEGAHTIVKKIRGSGAEVEHGTRESTNDVLFPTLSDGLGGMLMEMVHDQQVSLIDGLAMDIEFSPDVSSLRSLNRKEQGVVESRQKLTATTPQSWAEQLEAIEVNEMQEPPN